MTEVIGEIKEVKLPEEAKSLDEVAQECAAMLKDGDIKGAVAHAIDNTDGEEQQAELSKLVDTIVMSEAPVLEQGEEPTPPEAA